MEIRISVRNLVEFILRSGDIDNRRKSMSESAMADGSRIHRMLQRRMGDDYKAEVSLKFLCPGEEYNIIVEGRADGIITEQITSNLKVTIDEIKGTYSDIHKMKSAFPVHLAQAKCYAYIYGKQNQLDYITVRMTYCNMDTEEVRYFYEECRVVELEAWFEQLIEQYKKWADYEYKWKKIRQESIKECTFPFPYREGQKKLASYVYQTIYHKKKLFIEAPTGVGKTISTVYPAIKAIGENQADKLFYLTAKTITRTVADDTFQILRDQGLFFKTIILTAKDKICFLEETACNPVACPYAKGHLDRINEALFDLLTKEAYFSREIIETYAKNHLVCPFELSLDLSLFCDGVICDYNYLFDPHVYLKRFFAEGNKGSYLFLIDEAHNLVERGREMYSASLYKDEFLKWKKRMKEYDAKIEKQLERCNKEFLYLKRECETIKIVKSIDPLVQSLSHLVSSINKFLEESNDESVRNELLDFYFEISGFLEIYDYVDDNYVIYMQTEEDGFFVKLFCVNPSEKLRECMMRGRSSILFSATLLPIQYYKKLLGGTQEDYEVYAHSNFDAEKQALIIGNDVTSRFSRRGDMEYYKIASYIHEIVKSKFGNYMVFFPSHLFLQNVYRVYADYFQDLEKTECILQKEVMSEEEREQFLNHFSGNPLYDFSQTIHMEIEEEADKSLVGFCVLGGIFSEGIDLKNDSLIGAIIVGTGMPQIGHEREILREYFDQMENLNGSGFDYAYLFPGMNKVLQSAGRVIRTMEDIGIVALLDDRFMTAPYQRLFPREWQNFEVVTTSSVGTCLERFWEKW